MQAPDDKRPRLRHFQITNEGISEVSESRNTEPNNIRTAESNPENQTDRRIVRAGSSQISISRRLFLANGLIAAGTFFIGAPGVEAKQLLAKKEAKIKFNIAELQGKIKGKVYSGTDSKFNDIAYGGLWNKLAPTRKPQYIVNVDEEQDVIEAVKFAKANNIKVVVRGGGHNWAAPSLRNGGMMIDLTNLNKVISIDVENKKAVLQPIISNRDVQKALNEKGLSFPTGHCPPVKISGYLLGGGMSWNQGTWGPGVESVEAIEMVTPDGERITASATENQDYFWAARGAGSSFWAVALRYHLKLYPLPKYIAGSSYFFPYSEMANAAKLLDEIAKDMPSLVELSLWAVQAPPELAEKCKDTNNWACLITTSIFADSEQEAKDAVKLLSDSPLIAKSILKSDVKQSDFPSLFDLSGALWPSDLRCHVEALFSDAKLVDLMADTDQHILKSPSKKTVYMFAVFTGKNVPAKLPADAAFSMSARLYGGPWTMWDDAKDDAANSEWHEKLLKLMDPHIKGYYISESNTIKRPEILKKCFTPENFSKINQLRKKYDPTGVFFAPGEGIS